MFGTAADDLARYVAEAHIGAAIGGFGLAVFAVTWAGMSYSWFASAYDNDDWVFRVATMVQMVGVVVLALGVGDMFASLDHGVAPRQRRGCGWRWHRAIRRPPRSV